MRLLPTNELEAVIADLLPVLLAGARNWTGAVRAQVSRRCNRRCGVRDRLRRLLNCAVVLRRADLPTISVPCVSITDTVAGFIHNGVGRLKCILVSNQAADPNVNFAFENPRRIKTGILRKIGGLIYRFARRKDEWAERLLLRKKLGIGKHFSTPKLQFHLTSCDLGGRVPVILEAGLNLTISERRRPSFVSRSGAAI